MATKRKAQDAKIEDALAKKMGKNNPAAKPSDEARAQSASETVQDTPEGEANKLLADTEKATESAKAADTGGGATEGAKTATSDALENDANKELLTIAAPGHALVTYTGYVNLRAAPSTTARIAGRVGRGNRLEVLGTVEADGHTWYALPGGLYILGDAGLLNFYQR